MPIKIEKLDEKTLNTHTHSIYINSKLAYFCEPSYAILECFFFKFIVQCFFYVLFNNNRDTVSRI